MTEVWQVRYVGDGDVTSIAFAFSEPKAQKEYRRLLVVDDDGGQTSWSAESVPHRELEDGDDKFTSAKYGHTWHFAG